MPDQHLSPAVKTSLLRGWLERFLAPGSLARKLMGRLFPPISILVVLDLSVTWILTRRMSLEDWLLRDIFWTMALSQVLLVSLIAWVLLSGIRSQLASIDDLSQQIRNRSDDDFERLDASALPAEVVPLVEHFNELLERQRDTLQAQKRFIGHAAHQLRTPLTGLQLESELMLARPLPEDIRQRAERIKSVSDRMIRLGQQLLVLARTDADNNIKDSFVRLDLCEWVREEGGDWFLQARQHGVEIHLLAPEKPVWIDAAPILLRELLSNLMDNALRYGLGTDRIVLRVASNPPSLSVEDHGPGIEASEQQRVFEAFYRSPGTQAGGSGLGLAIVQEIARAHGAWWSLMSRPDFPGTRITIVFPGPRIGARLTRHDTLIGN
ncbi:sensor histidine kinase [Alcaligenes faecalis]|uniref:sensor histidine kinase n=1 Tax=Alcaligenes faecalis TaxID=511 RepID=UPI002933CF85|nr:HAMP domain-containing sensor histidine kinase [Alcaligenes faecalis]MDV2116431.1 HAMP domain-containing sensor histidine kinase [Alcaligenes faecalis]